VLTLLVWESPICVQAGRSTKYGKNGFFRRFFRLGFVRVSDSIGGKKKELWQSIAVTEVKSDSNRP
jgi:hypothetical protein